jgi:hypothetical protein
MNEISTKLLLGLALGVVFLVSVGMLGIAHNRQADEIEELRMTIAQLVEEER